jgi:hypothetical protein
LCYLYLCFWAFSFGHCVICICVFGLFHLAIVLSVFVFLGFFKPKNTNTDNTMAKWKSPKTQIQITRWPNEKAQKHKYR